MPIAFGNTTLDDVAVVATRDLVLNDFGRTLVNSTATSYNLTLLAATNTAIPVGAEITISQRGTGQLFFIPISPTTVNGTTSISAPAQYGSITLRKISSGAWVTV